ncbi:glycosyltransferase family 2 protein [Xylariaceae sp. FL1272]|nr:glycosyltransferase family 2 protein [Xylariaceae sp. FL1272]
MDNGRIPPQRAHSPGHPLQGGYQLDDVPYNTYGANPAQVSHSNLNMPNTGAPGRYTPSDNLPLNAAHSTDSFGHSPYGHQQGYSSEYSVNPEAHHDSYYNQPYEPHTATTPLNDHQGAFDHDEYDQRPMLQQNDSYAHGQAQEPYRDEPQSQQNNVPLKRWKTVKQVLLYNGNLVLDCPVPPRLLDQLPHGERDEFTHMRYSAATCDPNNFYDERFTLRQKLFSKPRHTELFIVVTMYNEDDILFARTMIGVLKNVEYMCSRKESKTWGPDAWKKIVVCVVSDGRAKINPRTRALLAGMGVYQEGIAKQQVNGKDVTAHIYEYTTQVGMQIKNNVVQLIPKKQPVQMLFCLKEKNQKKINSHRWFFSAFGRVLNPNICVLIDAGTRPGGNSIYHLWKAFDLEPSCAGACGEIKAMLGTGGKYLLNPVVAAQNFEYKMSNILDKPLESAFGFISVLPGAFSAYRYIALQNDKNGQGPLEKYFKGETLHGAGAGVFTANMYLAEDRILCFELVTKRNCHWVLSYVKSATGETDVPDTITEFILQRRRWLNGSFFASIYAIAHFYEFFRSDHSFIRKLAFFIEFVFQTVSQIFAWFAIGNFFLIFKILTNSLGDSTLLGNVGTILGVVFEWFYGVTLVACFVLSLGNRPAGSGKLYTGMVIFWSAIMVYLTFATVFISVRAVQSQIKEGFSISAIFQNEVFFSLVVSLLSTYGVWLIASLLMFDPWHMLTSFVQYIILTPTYVNVLNVYAFCNTHDISWGTKGDDKADELPKVDTKDGKGKTDLPDEGDLNAQYEKELAVFRQKQVVVKKAKTEAQLAEDQMDYYRWIRSLVVLIWIITNFGLVALVLSTAGVEDLSSSQTEDSETERTTLYTTIILWSVVGLSAFKFIGALWFLVVRLFRGV